MRSSHVSTITFSLQGVRSQEVDASALSKEIAQGILQGNNLSNDESDVETDEISEMMTLLHNQQEHLTKQNKEIKALKAKEKLHASFVSRYENLLNKFNLLDNEHKELKIKYESFDFFILFSEIFLLIMEKCHHLTNFIGFNIGFIIGGGVITYIVIT